jgi:predicted permease
MLDILTITSPIYIIIVIGFAMTRIAVFSKADMRIFGKFVINNALPALLFRSLSQRQIGEILNVSYLLAYLTGSLLVIGLGPFWFRRISGLATACSALALFVVGGTLVGLPLRGMASQVAPIVVGKLIFDPLAVLLAITLLSLLGLGEIDPLLRMAAVLMAAMPMMGIYPTLAQVYGQEDFSAVALLAATIASFFTISGWLWMFKHSSVWG